MSQQPRMVIKSYPNPDFRTYHVTELVTNVGYYESSGSPDNLNYVRINEAASALVDQLHAVKGVETVELNKYDIRITKGVAFTWEEVEPAVMECILHYLGWQEEDVSVSYPPSVHDPDLDTPDALNGLTRSFHEKP